MGAIAPSIEWLLAARFVQALGASAGLVTPRAIVADLCSLAESAHIFSLLMQVMMIAPVLAPIIGGYIMTHGDWRMVFWLLAVIGIAGLLWGLKSIPDSLAREQRVSLQAKTICVAYVRQLRNPIFMAYTLVGGFSFSALFVYISSSAFVFTEYYGLSPAHFSYVFASYSVGLIVAGAISNHLLKRGWNTQRILLWGICLLSVASAILFVVIQLNSGIISFIVYALILALAISALGLILGNVTALTMANAGPQAGTASALMGVVHYLLSAVVGYIVSLTAVSLGQLPLALTVCGGLALIFYFFATRTPN